LSNLQTPEDVQKLRTALHAKAKKEPEFRFYILYDKIYRTDVLTHAYRCCKANKGAAGVDEMRFEDIEAYGEERWLGELAERLKRKEYQPEAVRRVWIPKPDGKMRPLGIPTIKDRVVQTAATIVLEPIFEADLQPEQYGYREQKGAHDAVNAVRHLLSTGHQHIIDADLSGYFDSLPHPELMKCVARRVSDKRVLHLIKMWLDVPVEEEDEHGNRKLLFSRKFGILPIANPATKEAFEFGAAFPRGKNGMNCHSVSIDFPILPAPINAALFQDRGKRAYKLVWNRQDDARGSKTEADKFWVPI